MCHFLLFSGGGVMSLSPGVKKNSNSCNKEQGQLGYRLTFTLDKKDATLVRRLAFCEPGLSDKAFRSGFQL